MDKNLREAAEKLRKSNPEDYMQTFSDVVEELKSTSDCGASPEPERIKQAENLMVKFLPEELIEMKGDIVKFFYMLMLVYRGGYTGMGGQDYLVYGFDRNKFYTLTREITHQRLLSTYGTVVGVRDTHVKYDMHCDEEWTKMSSNLAFNVAEDILFAAYQGRVPTDYYVSLFKLNG